MGEVGWANGIDKHVLGESVPMGPMCISKKKMLWKLSEPGGGAQSAARSCASVGILPFQAPAPALAVAAGKYPLASP